LTIPVVSPFSIFLKKRDHLIGQPQKAAQNRDKRQIHYEKEGEIKQSEKKGESHS
jgi:hypothetical protein